MRGVQVIIATHSLELVDQLVLHWQRPDRPKEELALIRLALSGGALRTSRFDSGELRDLRLVAGDDLR